MSGNVYTIGISDMVVSTEPDARLITYALGSCIAVIGYDPLRHIGGLLHFQLPESGSFPDAAATPYKFGDLGIPAMLAALYKAGADRNRLVVGTFGGASMLKDEGVFEIGIRNARTCKKMLWQAALFVKHEDLGGTTNRTVSIDLDTGHIHMKKDGHTIEL
jgi:chemotaxis protein CheD